jgi:hypothetical protein
LKIHQALTAGQQSAWAYWQFTDGNPIGASTLTDATQRGSAAKYIAAKHFFRFIRPNAVCVAATVANAPSLNASAYLGVDNTTLTVVLVNSATNAASVQLQAPPLPAGLAGFQSFTSDTNALWVSNSVPIVNGTAAFTVPGYGICTLYGQAAAQSIPPAITQLPRSTNVAAGAKVQFSCVATGDALLSYQWLFDNLPIPGATDAALTLTNVQPFQAGQYAVLVTNAAGSITSFPATLGVSGSSTVTLITPKLSGAFSNGQVQLSFPANPGRIYSWHVSTNLTSWSGLTSFVSGGSPARLAIPPSPTPQIRYYRVSSP